MVSAAVFLKEGLEARGCFFAPKSFVLATSQGLARELASALEQAGIVIEAKLHGRDLGLDTTMGRARRVIIVATRAAEAKARMVKGKLAVAKHKRSRQITSVGAWPKFGWGRASHGTSPSETRRLKAAVAQGLGVARQGGCSTTGFEMHDLLGCDPEYRLPLNLVADFFKTLLLKPQIIPAAKAAIGHLAQKLRAKTQAQRWHWARAPVSTLVTTLLEQGWSVPAEGDGSLWRDEAGQDWHLDFADPACLEQFLLRFEITVKKRMWARASLFRNGTGSANGVDFLVAKRLARSFDRKQLAALRGALCCAVQGAAWPGQRLREAGYDTAGLCPSCGELETDFHFLWGCSRFSSATDKALVSSSKLAGEAAASWQAWPIFWLRGLPPAAWYDSIIGDHRPGEEVQFYEGGCFRDGASVTLPPGAFAATDGSGGRFASDPRLRRVAFSVVVFGPGYQILGFIVGSVTGPQTSNRAELMAIAVLMARSTGPCRVAVDSSFALRPFAFDSQAAEEGSCKVHLDLWGAVLQLRRSRAGGDISAIKVRSHLSLQVALAQGMEFWAWLGNLVADAFASWGASRFEVPPAVAAEVASLDGKARLVQRRLAAVIAEAAQRKRPRLARAADHRQGEQLEEEEKCSDDQQERDADPEASHELFRLGQVVACRRCGEGAFPPGRLPAYCRGFARPRLDDFHPSHEVILVRGLAVCIKCGARSSCRLRKLAWTCLSLTQAGRLVLAAVAEGRLPHRLASWPDEQG